MDEGPYVSGLGWDQGQVLLASRQQLSRAPFDCFWTKERSGGSLAARAGRSDGSRVGQRVLEQEQGTEKVSLASRSE